MATPAGVLKLPEAKRKASRLSRGRGQYVLLSPSGNVLRCIVLGRCTTKVGRLVVLKETGRRTSK